MEVLKQKYLVLQTAFLGDAILTLPFLQLLKKKNPGVLIDVIATPANSEIFQSSPSVNQVYILDKKNKHKSLFKSIEFIRELSSGYSRFYVLHRSFRSAMMSLFSGISESYGYDTSNMSFVYKHKIKYDSGKHEIRRHFAFLECEITDEEYNTLPEMSLTAGQTAVVENILANNNLVGAAILAVAPGSVWETKRYPTKYYLNIIEYFCNIGVKVVLLGGENEKLLCGELKINDSVIDLSGTLSIVESKMIIEKSIMLLTNDSASGHIGMAADARTLMIYCSTVPEFGFYPYNKKSAWIGVENLECKPCGIHGFKKCPKGHFKCAELLQPMEVIQKMEKMLDLR